MSSIDQKVVEARFESKQFIDGVAGTLSALQKLKDGLNLSGTTGNIGNATKSLSDLGSNVDKIAGRFSNMGIAATAAMATIANRAVDTGIRVVKSLTLDPVMEGFHNYETQIDAVQTILANTGLKGAAGLNQVTGVLNDLNVYANQTIYNFSEMARNIGTFTAAGVALKPAATAIKGIANLAAMSGSNSQQASTAMYQLSQALAAGRVKLMDWNSVVNAGMGGKVFQKALFDTGVAMHTIKSAKVGETFAEWTKAGHTFRDSLQDGWITSKVLTSTLSQFTGNMTDAQLKAQGFTKQQIKDIQEQAKVANEAATKIKTITQLMQALKEEVGTAFATVFKTVFGDINQAKSWLSPLHTAVENFLTGPIYALNNVLQSWSKAGGRIALFDGLKTGFNELGKVLVAVKSAFAEVFPPGVGNTLADMSKHFQTLMQNFKIGADTLNNIKNSFAGVFAVLDIIRQIIGGVVSGIGHLFSTLNQGGAASGGLLALTGGLGEFLVNVDKALKKSDAIKSFFTTLANILAVPLRLLTGVAGVIGKLFTGFDHHGAQQVTDAINSAGKALSPLQRLGQNVMNIFHKLSNMFGGLGGAIAHAVSGIGDAIAHAITPQTFDLALKSINTGLIGGMALMMRRFFKGTAGALKVDFGGGILSGFKDTMKTATETMKSMQQQIKAETILKIAIAMGILAASIVALGMIDAKKLGQGMIGVSVGIAGMNVSLIALTKHISIFGALKTPFLAAGLIMLGAALMEYAVAVKILSTIDPKDMLTGIGGLAAVLGILAGAMQIMPKNPLLIAQGAALVLFGVGLNAIALAMKMFATMSFMDTAHGLVALAGSLIIISSAMKLMPKNPFLIAQAAALTIFSVALNLLAMAMKVFGTMSFLDIAQGLTALGGALVIIAGAIQLMPKTMLLQAAGLLAVSVALNIMAAAMKIFATMSWEDIAKGFYAIGGALAILSLGLMAMEGAAPGAAALLIASAALALFTPVIVTLGNLDWGTLTKGLIALALTFGLLGVAGMLLAPVTPVLLGIGLAIALLGAGFALIGVGALAVATAFGIVIATLTAGLRVIEETGIEMATAIPVIMVAFATGILKSLEVFGRGAADIGKAIAGIMAAIVNAIIKYTPTILNFFVKILDILLNAIIKEAPKIGQAFSALLNVLINIVLKAAPRIGSAALQLLVTFLNIIANNIGRIVTAGANIIIAFIQGLGKNGVRIANAAGQAILDFINGLDKAINTYERPIIDAGGKMMADILKGLIIGIGDAPAQIAKKIGGGILSGAKHILGIGSPSKEFMKVGQFINQGLKIGLVGSQDDVVNTWHKMVDDTKAVLQSSADDVKRYKDRLDTLESAHKKNTKAINETKAALAQATLEHKRAAAVLDDLNKRHDTTYAKLQQLGQQHEKLKTQIDDANKSLQDSIKLRDDYNKQVTDNVSKLPDIGQDTQLTDFQNNMQYQINDAVKFAEVLGKLRSMGLNDTLYKELVDKGPASLQLAEQLLEAGQNGVAQLDAMSDQLKAAAGRLGSTASKELYQAGVNAAQGIVDGLNARLKATEQTMTKIAQTLVAALKKELKIKSPSQVMAELGQFVTKGVSEGMRAAIPHVDASALAVAKSAVGTLRQALSGVDAGVEANMSLNPTIAPVLDLSAVKKGAGQLDAVLADKSISIDAAYLTARNASAAYQANVAAAQSTNDIPPVATTEVNFTQINNSPKALSTADIYRNTNNQISKVKGALTSSAA